MPCRLKTIALPGIVLIALVLVLAYILGTNNPRFSEFVAQARGASTPQLLSQYNDRATLLGDRGRRLYPANNDPAGSQLISVSKARHGETEIQGNSIWYTPVTGYSGPDAFNYTARNQNGDTFRARVRLDIQRATPVELLLERMARQPETLAQVQYAPTNGRQVTAWQETLDRMRSDPWLARGFATVDAAIAAKRPVDLYVLIGDELLQGVTESGEFNDLGESFATALDRIWDTTPDQSNSNAILTLNCSVAGTSIVQWSNLHSPREDLPAWLQGKRDANLSEGCLFFLDWMLRDPRVPVVLRGLVIGFGTADLSLAQQESKLPGAWRQHLVQLVDLYRGSYGSDIALLLVPPLKVAADSVLSADWRRFNRTLRGLKTHNVSMVESRGLPQWQRDGELLLTDAGQRQLGERLARAAHDRWMDEWLYTPPESKPVLGAVGECSRQTPCFPGTNYLIAPRICARRDFFRPGGYTRLLCDQYGNSLHALAAGCNHCIDLEHIADTLGVGLVKTKTGQHFRPAAFMRQSLGGKRVEPLPYQNPHIIDAPRPCGYFDRESSTYLMPPGNYSLRVESRFSEHCSARERAACGLLLSPGRARREVFQREISIAAGRCTEILVQRPLGEVLTCGQQVTTDTVLGADMRCPEKLMDGLWIVQDGVTLDLNGYTIFGKPSPSFEQYGPSTAIKVHADNVTVKNGVIEGWDSGIFLEPARRTGFQVRKLTVRNLDVDDHNQQLFGIQMPRAVAAKIENVSFEFLSKFHADGMGTGMGSVTARRIRQFGGAASYTAGGYQCDHSIDDTHVELRESIISDAFLCSVFFQCVNSAQIDGNEFRWTGNSVSLLGGAPSGFCAHAGLPDSVKGVLLTENFIHGAHQSGLSFDGTKNSRAADNYIIDSGGRGIEMGHSLLCAHRETPGSHPLPDWFECFGASGNTLENNWVTSKWSSLTDLYENPRAHDNTWRNNICETIDGANIPPCLPEP